MIAVFLCLIWLTLLVLGLYIRAAVNNLRRLLSVVAHINSRVGEIRKAVTSLDEPLLSDIREIRSYSFKATKAMESLVEIHTEERFWRTYRDVMAARKAGDPIVQPPWLPKSVTDYGSDPDEA